MKDAALNVRVPASCKQELEALAGKVSQQLGYKISMSDYVANVLGRHVTAQRAKAGSKNIPIRGGK